MRVFFRSFFVALGKLRNVIIGLLLSIVVGVIIFQLFYPRTVGSYYPSNILDSALATMSLLLAMEIYEFPHEGELIIKLLYIIYPFLGLALVGLGIIEFGMFTFTFRYRIKAWNEVIAKKMKNHTILVGAAGNVGTRVLEELVRQKIATVVITKETERHREDIEQMLEHPDVSVIFGDAARSKVLNMANVKSARALIVVTNDDMLNFRIAIKAKELNSDIRTVIRTFDRVFGQKVTEIYDIDSAISTSAITAPAFVAQTFEEGIIQSMRSKKHKTDFHLTEITLKKDFTPVDVEFLEETYNVTILAVNEEVHPEATDQVTAGSKLLFLGDLDSIRNIKARYCY